MNFIKNNRDGIIASIIASIIYTVCTNIFGRLIELILPEYIVIWIRQHVGVSWIVTGVLLIVMNVSLIICFFGINHTVTIRKSLFRRSFNVTENELYIVSRTEVISTIKRQCINSTDANIYPTWYSWTGTKSNLLSNKDDCIAVKDAVQKDGLQRWHLEFRSTKKAYKQFDIDYTIHGLGEFSPVYGIYVNYPMKKLILKVKFNAQDDDLRLKYICRLCQVSNSDMDIDTVELEPDKYEYTYEVDHPKLFHHYRIEWVYKDC